MDKIKKGVQEIIDLGENWPAWNNVAKTKTAITKILNNYSTSEQQAISSELETLRSSLSHEDKYNILRVPHEVYLQVQANINKAPEPTHDDPVDTGGTPPIPDPVDPTENPNDTYGNEDEPDFEDETLPWVTEVRTRGQKIKSDSHDYGKLYPWETEKLDLEVVANFALDHWLTEEDKERLRSLQSRTEQINYLKTIIQRQRDEAERKKIEYSFDHIIDECYEVIPEYLQKEFGPELAKKFNVLTDKKNIHLVNTYDFLSVAGKSASTACGIFRDRNWDIYINLDYLKTKENLPPIAETPNTIFPHILWEIKHILIHELLHSQSIINYRWKYANGRRVWLSHVNYKNKTRKGDWYNEATTEHLTQDIMKYWYTEREWLDKSLYQAPWESYVAQQKIVSESITQVNKADDTTLSWNDFHKAMILRKYEDDNKNIKKATPLVELIRKMNGWKRLHTQKRPYFFQLVMDLCDLVLEKNISLALVINFIQKKDISLLKNYFQWSLNTAIKSDILLNKDKTDFNDLILQKYSPNTNIQKQFHPDGSEYVDYEEIN